MLYQQHHQKENSINNPISGFVWSLNYVFTNSSASKLLFRFWSDYLWLFIVFWTLSWYLQYYFLYNHQKYHNTAVATTYGVSFSRPTDCVFTMSDDSIICFPLYFCLNFVSLFFRSYSDMPNAIIYRSSNNITTHHQ